MTAYIIDEITNAIDTPTIPNDGPKIKIPDTIPNTDIILPYKTYLLFSIPKNFDTYIFTIAEETTAILIILSASTVSVYFGNKNGIRNGNTKIPNSATPIDKIMVSFFNLQFVIPLASSVRVNLNMIFSKIVITPKICNANE